MLKEGFPGREKLSKLAVKVSDLVRPVEGMRRFREMIRKADGEADESRAKRSDWEQRRDEHYRKVAAGDPSLTNYGAGPPERDWVWDIYITKPPGEPREIRGWTPPDLASACCPDDYSLIPLPTRKLTPAEEYTVLAAVRDYFFDRGVEPINPWHGQPNAEQAERAYSSLVKAVPVFYIEDVSALKEFLKDVRVDMEKSQVRGESSLKDEPGDGQVRRVAVPAQTADEAVALLGDEWGTYEQLATVTGKSTASIRGAIARARKSEKWKSIYEEPIPEARPTSAHKRFRIGVIWKFLPPVRARAQK